ncbi:MAG: 50S ribosomal protein L13 [Clostridiales bacterium]
MAKPADIQRTWYILDATGKPLGRLATEAARILRGKHKPIFTPHIDTGDHVIVINADKVVLTGNKLTQKKYYRHSSYPGGLKVVRYDDLMAKRPTFAVEKAIKGMLPHNRLGAASAKKLKVYAGDQHPHEAQQPQVWVF